MQGASKWYHAYNVDPLPIRMGAPGLVACGLFFPIPFLAWEDYSNLLAEYGVKLQNGVSFAESAIFVDPILKFNPEVQILGIHPWFGVLVGGLQDSYLGIFDLACRAQPFIHSTICYVLLQHQTDFARTILLSMQRQSALTTLTQELVLVAILDKCFQSKWNVEVLEKALILLKDPENEMETYCEIVANVARKVEPNRLPLLFPLAGDPSQLLQLCRQRNEIRTAANFLLCLDESITNEQASLRPRTNSFAQFQSRSGLAFELLVDCCEKEHLHLALQVVRVARAWEPEHYRSSNQQYDRYIDEQVGKYAFQMLVQHRFDKVVWLLTQVEATLPQLYDTFAGAFDRKPTQNITHRRRCCAIRSMGLFDQEPPRSAETIAVVPQRRKLHSTLWLPLIRFGYGE
ncbi:unnamed protein product [Aphanomyces euteiches]